MYMKVRSLDDKQELTVADDQALAEFRHQLRHFLAFSEQVTRAVGLEPQQHQLLLALQALSTQGTVTVSDLAEWLVCWEISGANGLDFFVIWASTRLWENLVILP